MGRDHSLDRDSNSSTNSVLEIPKYKKVKNKKATAITSAIFGVLTILSIILSVCAVSISFGKVMGTVEKVYSRKIFNETYYYTSYEYVVDSQTYYAESQTGWTMLPDPIHIYMGSQYELYYKKSNPYIIYEIEDKENLPTLKPVFLAFAFILGITTICILVIGVGKYQLNPEWVQAQKIAEDKEKMQGKKRCDYCASIMDENLNKCTSCGAPLK